MASKYFATVSGVYPGWAPLQQSNIQELLQCWYDCEAQNSVYQQPPLGMEQQHSLEVRSDENMVTV